MFTTLLMTCLLLAGILLAFRRPRAGVALLAAVLLLGCWAGSGRLPRTLLANLQRPHLRLQQPHWGDRNAVVLLGAGVQRGPGGACQPTLLAYPRILEAVRLVRQCQASGRPCTLLITGGDPARLGISEAALYREEVLALGIPAPSVLLEPRSLNTYQNAEFTAPLLKAGGYDQVLLVTSALHMRRSLLYFGRFGAVCAPAVADQAQAQSSWMPLGVNLALTDLACHEYLGMARLRVYNALGLNGKPAAA